MAESERVLFTVPPERFVAERDEWAKRLRAAGDKGRAAQVRRLRRPSVAEWALNLLAVRDPAAVAGFAGAVGRVRAEQQTAVAEGHGAPLREALHDLQRATARVVAAARATLEGEGRAAAPHLPAVTSVLQAAAASPAVLDRLLSATLGGPLPADSSELLAEMVQASPERRGAGAARDERREQGASDAAAGRARDERIEEARRAVDVARSAADEAEEALARARDDLDRAQRLVEEASARRQEAERMLERARARLRDAEAS